MPGRPGGFTVDSADPPEGQFTPNIEEIWKTIKDENARTRLSGQGEAQGILRTWRWRLESHQQKKPVPAPGAQGADGRQL